MASPDTIMLLFVDYRAAIGGGKTPVSPLAYAPEHCSLLHDVCAWGAVCYFTGTLTLTQDIVNSASGAIVYAGVCVRLSD